MHSRRQFLAADPGADPGSRGAPTAYPIAGYTAALENMTKAGRIAATLDQARQIFPELAHECEGGIAHCWELDPWQRGSFALHTPNQIGFIELLAAAEGRIHFAGEHTSLWTGWMQGALRIGSAGRARSKRLSRCGRYNEGSRDARLKPRAPGN